MKAKVEELGIMPSYSRSRVSNDNLYSEALFRTLKYRPEWSSSGFADLEADEIGCGSLRFSTTTDIGTAS